MLVVVAPLLPVFVQQVLTPQPQLLHALLAMPLILTTVLWLA